MTQYKAISKLTSDAKLREIFESNVLGIRDEVLKSMAEEIAMRSAATVDTGTYARGHRVAQRSGSFQPTDSSHGKPRHVEAGPPKQDGLDAMMAGINNLPPDAKNVVFRNTAVHAKYVESIGWENADPPKKPYRIYASVRNNFNNHVNDALAKLGLKIR